MESRNDPPNLVAKLMGLEALPKQKPGSVVPRNHSGGYPRNSSDVSMSYWKQQDEFSHYLNPNEHKATLEIRQQPQRSSHVARSKKTTDDRKMGLVRQNFIEAKRLSVNERHRQSKKFQDALEVLSSNKDLFLKCLQEPHSVTSENLYSRQSASSHPETKRITILRPTKRIENNDSVETGIRDTKKIKKGASPQQNGLEKVQPGSSSPEGLNCYKNPSLPTKIVVLKPTRKKACNDMTVASPHSEQPMLLQREDFFRHIEEGEGQESRDVAKGIALHAKFGQHHKNGDLISSVLLNDYIGDDSSFNKLELGYVGDNLCHSEAISSVSNLSGDYVDMLSPYSTCTSSRPSYSPESSVTREAKKRLSERWAMMPPNEIGQEQKQYQRSSSTLGEMLALTETKPLYSHGEEGSSSQESGDFDFLFVNQWRRDGEMDNPPRNLMRSKSVPVSGWIGTGLNIGSSVSREEKSESYKEDGKVSYAKSSLKGKVSGLFLSTEAKKANKETSVVSHTKDGFYLHPGDIDRTVGLNDKGSIHAFSPLEPSRTAPSSESICTKMMSPENGLVTEKLRASRSLSKNLDQPSPISVLGPSFEEEYIQKSASYYAKPEQQGVESPRLSIGSRMIDKSPPIGSIARSPCSNDPFVNAGSSHPSKKLTTKETDEEERNGLFFIKGLLAEAGRQYEARPTSYVTRCHSLQSPLDPSFRGQSINSQDDKNLPDGTLRQKQAVQQLVHDCVNAALVNAGYDSHLGQRLHTSTIPNLIGEKVLGNGWINHFGLEMDDLCRKIEGRLLEELMQELVVELACRM
ncbi:hypothetical protein SASPL_102863 [Salvia splendens]|uniref:DUF3741 domain-containing protein n=1 Tax=Salvia splendens TaxID=180675 RepID=A0A8X8YWQ5_SALSN|nr:uncharacterized protein LOC121752877 [Salvia splendens]XP_042003907.1 uncharacterized protein LOC121752877 [Salvia splendens]XP_042003911.1 uncharacterized protein LOC121752877 [Salvia splendens]XP_042003914.1 uncharacterized protein LOC121752877 [Salvia splendens]KAG6437932.1 hypothetical protein SASPL_102863 [Salvia splendens]